MRIVAKDLPENWIPQPGTVKAFVAEHIPFKNAGNSEFEAPASVRAMDRVASSLEEVKVAEKARFLPKVGLFGTGDFYGGGRGAATSVTGGAYVAWDLFSAPNFGAMAQAGHAAAAAQARADALSQRAQIVRTSARFSAEAFEKNLSLLESSANLLEEQTATARGLFRNGSINALQLVEVLARRVDLTVSRAEAELGLTQSHAAVLVNSGVEGVSYEN